MGDREVNGDAAAGQGEDSTSQEAVEVGEASSQEAVDASVQGEATHKEAGSTSKSRRSGSGRSRFGHRRSPTTGHRVRRNKTPEPNFVPIKEADPKDAKEAKEREKKRSLSSPGEARDPAYKRISSSEEDEERKPRRISKSKSDSLKTKLESAKRWSGVSSTPTDPSSDDARQRTAAKPPPSKPRSKSTGREEKGENGEKSSSWWKSLPSWAQRIRGKSLEREPGSRAPLVAPPRRNKSLERPPVIKEKERRAALKKEKETPPVPKKRSKSKPRSISDEENRLINRQPSVEESSDEFWKSGGGEGVRKRIVAKEESPKVNDTTSLNEDSSKQLVLVEAVIENDKKEKDKDSDKEDKDEEKKVPVKSERFLRLKAILKELSSTSVRETYKEVRTEWNIFLLANPNEIGRLKSMRNKCISSFVILVIYCGTGAMVFKFIEGAFENFYKCGVKRVKRDFVDSLWTASHHLREEEWKSQARRKLMDFENQLHNAYEAGMMSYSGLKAWSFLNAFAYCWTVVTTIGYGHISPSTTTGRAITIIYAIFGIPMFLILLADFGKLFTRGIKFIWAFVRRVYYTGSCRRVRRTAQVQCGSRGSRRNLGVDYDLATPSERRTLSERSSRDHLENGDGSITPDNDSEVMKGVQMVYDIATFRRPSQLPPGVTLDDMPPPRPPAPNTASGSGYTPGDPPGTPALSTFAIDDEFNLPISVAIFILLIYIFCGATVFYVWESWGFFESFYFVFISMSTIGFGDFVPQGLIDPPDPEGADKKALISPNQMYMMASIVYLVFGLALTSMCVNVVQEKLSDSFRQASAKIGATIGLRVSEDDGAVTPVAPAPVEIAEVHSKGGEHPTQERSS